MRLDGDSSSPKETNERFPISEAFSKISLETSRNLIPLLSVLGEKLRDDGRYRLRNPLQALSNRGRLSRDMAVHPLHRIGRVKRKDTREHFVKGNAERIEIAPGIDGTIHSSGLLRCHVGECPCYKLRRFGRLAFAWKPRSDTKTRQPGLAGRRVHQNISWLDVLMNNAALMQLADRDRKVNSQTQ